ncbi:MAG: gamma-glutamylcyclotransferase family protein [Rhodovibrionaceae bacterium]|nr:gamma-glutamylcyclotransferase family protein [Rhodovibrionaceae bacterium]
MSLFFYGTLLDEDVRRLVLGLSRAERLELCPARLYGFRRVQASVGDYPILKPQPGAAVDGAIAFDRYAWTDGESVRALDRAALARIAHFEGDEYMLRKRPVWLGDRDWTEAWIFLPTHARYVTRRRWDLERWQRRSKPGLMPYFAWLMRQPTIAQIGAADVPWRLRRRSRQVAEKINVPVPQAERKKAAE